MARMLESEEAARRLGVKLATLYAYVSRGLLVSQPSNDGRRSLFAADDVEALARRSRGGRTTATRLATVTTSVSQLRDEGPAYRGRPAMALASSASYEEVAALLWGVEAAGLAWGPLRLRPPKALGPADRLRWAVVMAGAGDRVRSDLRRASVAGAGARLIATMVAALAGDPAVPAPPLVLGDRRLEDTVAGRLAARLAAEPTRAAAEALNRALVLLADHELATSTLAVRVAASTRADPYAALLAGLGVMAGPLHGGAPRQARALLREVARVGPERAVDEALRSGRPLPGFGHAVYEEADPRAQALVAAIEALGDVPGRGELAGLVALGASRGLPPPNVDLATAALSVALGLPDNAPETVFTLARVAGWIAHYLEELDEAPLRYRARAVYASRP